METLGFCGVQRVMVGPGPRRVKAPVSLTGSSSRGARSPLRDREESLMPCRSAPLPAPPPHRPFARVVGWQLLLVRRAPTARQSCPHTRRTSLAPSERWFHHNVGSPCSRSVFFTTDPPAGPTLSVAVSANGVGAGAWGRSHLPGLDQRLSFSVAPLAILLCPRDFGINP